MSCQVSYFTIYLYLFKNRTKKLLNYSTSSGENKFMSAFGQQQICNNAQIGISIEPEANAQLLPNSEVGHTLFKLPGATKLL